MVASDKLFYWLFQQHAERLQPLVAELLPRMEGYVFSAPVLKEREYRLDGLFLPPADQPDLPVLILEAQMAADPGFLLRLNAETARLLQQQDRQGRAIRHWQVVVICPSRDLNFGDPTPVQEFVNRRVVWIELLSERLPRSAPPLQKALAMLLLPEDQLPACSKAIRAEAAGTGLAAEIDDVIAAILVSRFSGRAVPEICARGCKPVSDGAAGLAAHLPVLGTFQGSPQPGGATRSRGHPATHKASCPPISPSPAPPVVLQRMSLPADRPPRLPTRGNFQPPHRAAPRAPISYGAPPAGRSRFPRHPAGPAARGLPSLRTLGGHPADHPPFLPAAGLCVAGLGGISLIRLAGAWKC